MMSALFSQTMEFKKLGLEKEIYFYDPKDGDKKLWFWNSFFLLAA